MRYLGRTDINKIKEDYDHIIGWGTGPIFKMNYRKDGYPIDFLIDGSGKNIGNICNGLRVEEPEILRNLNGKKLVVIFAIYEKEILEQIDQYDDSDIDTIIYSLLDITLPNGCRIPEINGKSCEDLLLISLIRQLNLEKISFIEIGVCHPVIRNNTYMIYENYSYNEEIYNGVLVEANPICWSLIEDYRPHDRLVKNGVVPSKKSAGDLTFYMFPHLLGHSTFSKEIAEGLKRTEECCEMTIPVTTIDRLIADYFDGEAVDILGIDAEGLDYEILNDWDSEKYPFKIIVSEAGINEDNSAMEDAMKKKGYLIYARTLENIIWVRKDIKLFV